MSTVRWCTAVGVVVGVVWAFQGVGGALVVLVCALIGAGVGILASRRVIDWRALIRDRDDS